MAEGLEKNIYMSCALKTCFKFILGYFYHFVYLYRKYYKNIALKQFIKKISDFKKKTQH